MSIRMQKDHIHMLKMLLSTSEFGADCANTKIIQHALKVPDSVFIMLKLTYTEKNILDFPFLI